MRSRSRSAAVRAAALIGKRAGWPQGHALGWSALAALAAAAGIDAWLLCRTGVMRLASPLYAWIPLARIHDPVLLHVGVVFEALGALAGAVSG